MRKGQSDMKKFVWYALICLHIFSVPLYGQKIYPSHWWTGMKNQDLQLMVHHDGVGNRMPYYKLPVSGSKIAEGIILKKVHHAENPNYVFLDLTIEKNAKPGTKKLVF